LFQAVSSDLQDMMPATHAATAVEDLPIGPWRVRVERIGTTSYLWSVYVAEDARGGHRRGMAESREAAWQAAMDRATRLLG